ncbi:transcription initiation factor TFIID subunit 5-like protein [Trifolium pratense]|uniref:Transcription initiation factor TFIID subunit 5-like protein n=1 Tax=Trifolium pratense TaxID=57577 RepID=A0A2K3PGM1_TRIPR|nr:transcription initiation factor TFIID subunit 5-like protein [Trifolium pratense]
MDEHQILGFVAAYLKKKGFKQTEKVFQEEFQQNKSNSSSNSNLEPDIANHLLAFSQLENGPARYHNGYSRLRTWTYSSLDLYRHELLRVLYPVFIHCFMDLVAKGHIQEARNFFTTFREDHEMMHLRDIQKLEGVLSPTHLKEMEFAHSLRQSKFNIKICEYSYELLLQHLHSTQSTTILGIINEHINFQVTSGQPSLISDDPEAVTLTGSSQEAANQTNQKEIHWGLLEDSLEERLEKPGALLSDSEKGDGEAKEGENDESKKRSIEGGKQGASVKKMKKDKGGSATGKIGKAEAIVVPAAPRVKSDLPLPVMYALKSKSLFYVLKTRYRMYI